MGTWSLKIRILLATVIFLKAGYCQSILQTVFFLVCFISPLAISFLVQKGPNSERLRGGRSAARSTTELTRFLFSHVNVGFGLGGDHCCCALGPPVPPVLRAPQPYTDSSFKSNSRLLTVVSCQLRLQLLHHAVLQLHHQLHYEQCTVHLS